jgi:predicted ATP-dependent serine protease
VRAVRRLRNRMRAVESLGFRSLVCPRGSKDDQAEVSSCTAFRVTNLNDAIRSLFGKGEKLDG